MFHCLCVCVCVKVWAIVIVSALFLCPLRESERVLQMTQQVSPSGQGAARAKWSKLCSRGVIESDFCKVTGNISFGNCVLKGKK